MNDYQYYRAVISRIRRPRTSITSGERKSIDVTLETYMSYGLGSYEDGRTVVQLCCSNDRAPGPERGICPNDALLACSQCSLVKYCSGRCQRQHWPSHRIDCESALNQASWQPSWVIENRHPLFCTPKTTTSKSIKNRLWGRFPGYDILQLHCNEGSSLSLHRDFKLCFAAAADIRNIVQTVNKLPKGYRGKCDILLNDADAISANRNLLILYILTSPGPSIDEAAELALHLMYSSRLTALGAAHVRRCAHLVYGDGYRESDMTFQRCFSTRGPGKLYSAQPSMSIKRPIEMFLSRYELPKAMGRMRDVLFDPSRIDDRHKYLAALQPAHRLAHLRMWKTGVLAPYSLDLTPFTHPNRLAFSPHGGWLGMTDDLSPLHGWDISSVHRMGIKHGLDPGGDIFGCLFFYIKQELREFALRMKNFHVNIHHTQYDSRLLSKGVSIGVLPSFSDASFDRIDLSDMGDTLGVSECLADWGPLLKKSNGDSCVILHSSKWHNAHRVPTSPIPETENVLDFLKWRCRNIPSLEPRIKKLLAQGPYSLPVIRLIESLDAFIDHEEGFRDYLHANEVGLTAGTLGLRLRRRNRVHAKRFGIPIDAPYWQKLPDVSKEEYYELFTIGGADLLTQFVEFELTN